MHKTQAELLRLSKQQDLGKLSLRHIAKLVGVENKPQIVKHHLLQLEKAGLLQVNLDEGIIKPVQRGFLSNIAKNILYSLPIVGTANCGTPNVFADERIEGFLKVSSKMLPRKKSDLYVIIADGDSMNLANVHDGLNIENGDYVVVDSSQKNPKSGEIVVAVIDGMATIKIYREDKPNKRIILAPQSTENHLPIFLHEGDDFVFSGKVVDVIKKNN